MMLGLVSRPPSGCERSRLSSKISRHRSASPRWVLARPNSVSPATTVTRLPMSPTDSGGSVACAAATSVVARRLGDGGRHRGAIGTTMSTAATSRWARKPTPRRAGGGGAKPAGGAERRSLTCWRTSTTRAAANRSHTNHASTVSTPTTRATSLTRAGCGRATGCRRTRSAAAGPRRAAGLSRRSPRGPQEQPSVHGALPTPAAGEAVELDDTDRPPGRMT